MTQLAVAVSGGVDSLCALLRLREQGHDVLALHGLFLPDAASSGLRPAPEGPRLLTAAEALTAPLPPASRQAVEGLQTACGQLGIPLHVADMRAVFDREVVTPFVRAYARGRTPNPCALCNRAIKFGALLDAALSLGADRIATGHYARLLDGPAGPVLAAADDLAKDQRSGSYNPLPLRFSVQEGKLTEESRQELAQTMDRSVERMAAAFELLECGVWQPVIESVVYAGLYQVGNAVLNGTFHQRPRREKYPERKAGHGDA